MVDRSKSEAQALKRALVVGGQEAYVKDRLSRNLARHGIGVHTHWSWTRRKAPAKFPVDIDLVYICTDMVGHNLATPSVDYARAAGIPFVNGTRKWAESIERLTQAGYPLLDPMNDLPDMIAEVIAARPPGTPPTDEDLRGIAIAVAGNVERAEQFLDPTYNAARGTVDMKIPISITPSSAVLNAVLPEPPKEYPVPLPASSPPGDTRRVSNSLTNIRQQAYLKVLIQHPRLMNKQVWDALKDDPLFAGMKMDPTRLAAARDQLGISVTRGNNKRYTVIDLEKFMETAELLKVDYVLPEATYEDPDHADPIYGVVPSGQSNIHQEEPIVQPPAPAVPVVEVQPAPTDIAALVRALRAKMQEESIVELHITAAGVTFKQVKVVEGVLEL